MTIEEAIERHDFVKKIEQAILEAVGEMGDVLKSGDVGIQELARNALRQEILTKLGIKEESK